MIDSNAKLRSIQMPFACCQSNIPLMVVSEMVCRYFCGLFLSGYRAPPHSLSLPAFRSVLVSRDISRNTLTARPEQAVQCSHQQTRLQCILPAVHGALSLPGQLCWWGDDVFSFPTIRRIRWDRWYRNVSGTPERLAFRLYTQPNRLSLNTTFFLADIPFLLERGNQLAVRVKSRRKGSSKLVT